MRNGTCQGPRNNSLFTHGARIYDRTAVTIFIDSPDTNEIDVPGPRSKNEITNISDINSTATSLSILASHFSSVSLVSREVTMPAFFGSDHENAGTINRRKTGIANRSLIENSRLDMRHSVINVRVRITEYDMLSVSKRQ
jgi:hypothetical protein